MKPYIVDKYSSGQYFLPKRYEVKAGNIIVTRDYQLKLNRKGFLLNESMSMNSGLPQSFFEDFCYTFPSAEVVYEKVTEAAEFRKKEQEAEKKTKKEAMITKKTNAFAKSLPEKLKIAGPSIAFVQFNLFWDFTQEANVTTVTNALVKVRSSLGKQQDFVESNALVQWFMHCVLNQVIIMSGTDYSTIPNAELEKCWKLLSVYGLADTKKPQKQDLKQVLARRARAALLLFNFNLAFCAQFKMIPNWMFVAWTNSSSLYQISSALLHADKYKEGGWV